MNNIKSLFLLVSVLSLCSGSIAQHIGLQAGGLISNVKWRNDIFTVNTNVKPGFMAGITLDIPLKNKMAINTAINYKYMGALFNDTTDLGSFRFGYINLDVTYCYLFDMKTFQLYAEVGGYFAVLVQAQSVYKPEGQDAVVTDLEIGTEITDQVKPLDAGLSIGGGVYYNKWKFGIGYQPGLINLSPQDTYILRNKMAYLRVAFLFNRKPKAPKEKAQP